MHSKSIFVSAITALTLFSPAVTAAAIRRSEPAAAPSHTPAQSGSYSIVYKTDKGGEETAYATEKGSIHVEIKGVLVRVEIDDKDDIAQCIVKDKDYNQIRKFGGKDIEQTYIDFEEEDGKQAKFIDCAIGENKEGGHQWDDSKKPQPSNTWGDAPKESWVDAPPKSTQTRWEDSHKPTPTPVESHQWQDHPIQSTSSSYKPQETKWEAAPAPKPEEPKLWEDKPAPSPQPTTTYSPPPPQHTQSWSDSKPQPQEPKPEPPKQEGWGDAGQPKQPEQPKQDGWQDNHGKPAEQPAPAPAPAHEAPKPQEGWQDSNGHGKPQEGSHGGPQGGEGAGPQGGH